LRPEGFEAETEAETETEIETEAENEAETETEIEIETEIETETIKNWFLEDVSRVETLHKHCIFV